MHKTMVGGGAVTRPVSMDKDIFYGYNPSFRDVPVCKANNGAVPYVTFGVLLIIFLNATAPCQL